jgi:hypothetical protein
LCAGCREYAAQQEASEFLLRARQHLINRVDEQSDWESAMELNHSIGVLFDLSETVSA